MKREIKFRAKIKGLPIILEGIALYSDGMIGVSPDELESQLPESYKVDCGNKYVIKDDTVLCDFVSGDEWIFFCDHDIELMQFTGLKDKNGKEIFEGDILKVVTKSLPKGKDNSGYTFKGLVEYDYGKYIIRFNEKFRLNNELACWALNHSEIIGNIYENPNLIK